MTERKSNINKFGIKEKKTNVYIEEKKSIDFKLRLRYDNLSMADFFRLCIDGYLEKDPFMVEFFENYIRQKKPKKDSLQALRKLKMNKTKEDKLAEKFNFDKKDISHIFDILENEHPEL